MKAVHDEELEIRKQVTPLGDDNDAASSMLSSRVWLAAGVCGQWSTFASNDRTLIRHRHLCSQGLDSNL